MSNDMQRLMDKLKKAKGNYDKMRGFRAALTIWCRKRAKETGTPEYYFERAFKAVATRKGLQVTG